MTKTPMAKERTERGRKEEKEEEQGSDLTGLAQRS